MSDKDSIIAQIDNDIREVREDLESADFDFEESEYHFENDIILYYSRAGYFVSMQDHCLIVKWN